MGKMNLDLWIQERDEAILSFDINKFKEFYEKWEKRGFYNIALPENDKILEISLRKMVIVMKNPPKDKLEEAKKWLRKHGCSETI